MSKKKFVPYYKRNRDKGKRNHSYYVFDEDRKDNRTQYYGIGVTHSEYTNKVKNVPLPKNDNKDDPKKNYALNKVEVMHKSTGRKMPWKVSKENKKVFDSIIDKAKDRYK